MTNRPHRPRSANRAAALIALALTPLFASCAGTGTSSTFNRGHEATRATYNRDARNCVGQNTVPPTASAKSAGNIAPTASGSVNTPGYLRCMTLLGYNQTASSDPMLKALDRCRQLAAGPKTATASSGGVAVSSGINKADFKDCMKERGFGDISVEPLQPSPAK